MFRGALRRLWGLTTDMFCADGSCCNDATAMLGVGDGETAMPILTAGESDAFACTGDDSTTCCAVTMPAREVLVRGNVVRYARRFSGYAIADAEVCVVP